ncbi:acyl-ACP--UDP-N-acetylglucosamine O-acyltransferase [Opitutus sp. ER46]|uniref:acyl-ACP--UDP-N-acetylglucosamine O-acyltransferase n=1 Tax=Opitutus sp. ER46 TaxID=2161864 RepID=UPI000D31477A|nr:acyl-ACP--UDP-N-acetylglucosamine O-acyltransferase [Opitutus sp. ER46]PTX97804.1 acyl-ACP--UDP-N-acetylglucosamine O-acyltransferase [Opitutus sp. ER46]
MIHPTAIVEPGAQLGAECEIMAHAIITRHAVLGDRVVVHPFAVIGGDPQYLGFNRALPTYVRIGAGTVIREHVTVNRSIYEGKATQIGEECFLMASSHVAHDCAVGRKVVLANAALLAGHAQVGDFTFVGGAAAMHQFCRIGEGVMVAGHAAITRDVPHYTMVAERDDIIGFNVVGLKRRGFSRAAIAELKAAFHDVYFTPGNIRTVAAERLASGAFQSVEARRFLEFFAGGKRGFARARRAGCPEGEESA